MQINNKLDNVNKYIDIDNLMSIDINR